MSSDSSMLRERREDSPHAPAQLREAAGMGVEDLLSPSPRFSFYTAGRRAGTHPPAPGQPMGPHDLPAARGRHSQVVKNDEAPS